MSSKAITDSIFNRVALLSRLEIKPEEAFIKDQLDQAAQYIEILQEINTDKVNPTYQVNHKTNVFRDDIVTPSLTQKQALSQASNTKNGYFVTSATIKK